MKNNKGFSLVELIVVIAIMAILAAVAIPTFATFITKANMASDVSFINDLTHAAELAHTASGDDVTGVQVAIDANGAITGATYMVDDVTVTISYDETDKKWEAEATKGEEEITAVQNAANDTIATIDWTYTFKTVKVAGNYIIDTNGEVSAKN